MAKIYIKPNPEVNPLVGFIKIEEKRTTKDAKGNEVTETDYIQNKFTRAPGTSVRICANPSMSRHGNLNHGMDYEIPNPYKDYDLFTDPKFEAALKGREKAKVQHILEFKWGKQFNYLTNQFVDPTEVSDTKEIPVLMKGDYTLELSDGATILDTDTEFGEIMSYIIRANSLIANSYEERNSTTPFYIAHEAEEAKVKQQREAMSDRSLAKLVDLFDNNKEELGKFCKALDIPKRATTAEAAYNELKNYIKRSVDNAKLFVSLYTMWSEPATKNEFQARVLLYDARYHGIILKDGATYTWQRPKSEDGTPQKPMEFTKYTGENSIIEFLSHPKFGNEQNELLEQVTRATQYRK